MGKRLEGKVAFITGAARGQGKSHAIRLAQEGANIIAIDLCEQIPSVRYPMGSDEDLADTVSSVEATGQRIIAAKADVRERSQLKEVLDAAVAEMGGLDVVCANAGILPCKDKSPTAFLDALDVDFGGVLNTMAVSVPHLASGASIIITGSTAAMLPNALDNPVMGPGAVGYGLAKKYVLDLVESLAVQLAPEMIRVNGVHPTNVNTNLINNDDIYRAFRPDVENPTQEDALPAFEAFQAMPIAFIEPVDISNAILFLASDEARYVTGINMRIDAGSLLIAPDGPAQ